MTEIKITPKKGSVLTTHFSTFFFPVVYEMTDLWQIYTPYSIELNYLLGHWQARSPYKQAVLQINIGLLNYLGYKRSLDDIFSNMLLKVDCSVP